MTDPILILDYGMGNLRSVSNALTRLGAAHEVVSDPSQAKKLIIPGVGAFAAAMERLSPLQDTIARLAVDGVPILGICLGQQLLLDESEEFGLHPGLGLIRGKVRYLPSEKLKVPQIGWNEVAFRSGSVLGHGIEPGSQVYFVHSLYTDCSDPADVAGRTCYGIEFASAIERNNVMGVQFHPEKSGDVGLEILRNFVCM